MTIFLPNLYWTKGFSSTGTEQKVSPQSGLNKGLLPNWNWKKGFSPIGTEQRFLPNRDWTKGFSPIGTEQRASPQLELKKRFLPNRDWTKVSPQLGLSKQKISCCERPQCQMKTSWTLQGITSSNYRPSFTVCGNLVHWREKWSIYWPDSDRNWLHFDIYLVFLRNLKG